MAGHILHEIAIYNPAQSVSVSADKNIVLRGETFILSAVISEFATSRDIVYEILDGAEFVETLSNGVYAVKSKR